MFYIFREYLPRDAKRKWFDEDRSVFSEMGRDNGDGTFTRVERGEDEVGPRAFDSEAAARAYLEQMKRADLFPCYSDEDQLQHVWVEEFDGLAEFKTRGVVNWRGESAPPPQARTVTNAITTAVPA